jgi:N-acetylneuraminate lyase/4-hydroxy-tetrahydrodipicolinate synthase
MLGSFVKYHVINVTIDGGNKLHGILVPLITPFDEKGEVKVDSIDQIVNFTYPYVHGYYICGTYGSGPLMRIDQRELVLEKIVERVKGSKSIVAHIGSPDTETAVKLAKHAEDVGADAVASVPPYYYAHSEAHIVEYFREIAGTVSIPVYAYNNPQRVGYQITPQLALKLREAGVVGVKDSSFDIQLFIEYKLTVGEDFEVIIGTEALMVPGYILGARAFIPGMSNYAPEVIHKLFELLEKGEIQKAAELQFRVNKVRRELHKLGSMLPVVYLAVKSRGIDPGLPRKPFLPAPQTLQEKIELYLKELGES